jgi:hypothetical protein
VNIGLVRFKSFAYLTEIYYLRLRGVLATLLESLDGGRAERIDPVYRASSRAAPSATSVACCSTPSHQQGRAERIHCRRTSYVSLDGGRAERTVTVELTNQRPRTLTPS